MRKRNVVIGILGVVFVTAIVFSFFKSDPSSSRTDLDISDVIAAGRAGAIDHIDVARNNLDVYFKNDATRYESHVGSNVEIVLLLESAGVTVGGSGADDVRVHYREGTGPTAAFGIPVAGILVLIIVFVGLLYFMIRNGVREGARRGRADVVPDASDLIE